MRVIVVTYGTEGDARPFGALCRGLMDAGHETRLLADAGTLESARSLGVPTTELSGDIRSTLAGDQGVTRVVANGKSLGATVRALAKIANGNAQCWLRAIIEAGDGCDAVVAAGLASFAGFSAAEYLRVKGIGAGMIPITPNAAFPSPFLARKWVPRCLNRRSHAFVNGMLWRSFRDKTNAARAVFKLPPRKAVWTEPPMVYGISSYLLPRPDDWPCDAHLCGQWLAPSPKWIPPPALADFLTAGEAPIYIGFGSMAGFDKVRLLDALIEAMARRRALFHVGWSGIEPNALPANFLAIGDTPHDWLFPRTAAVIHHGGSGTSHSAAYGLAQNGFELLSGGFTWIAQIDFVMVPRLNELVGGKEFPMQAREDRPFVIKRTDVQRLHGPPFVQPFESQLGNGRQVFLRGCLRNRLLGHRAPDKVRHGDHHRP